MPLESFLFSSLKIEPFRYDCYTNKLINITRQAELDGDDGLFIGPPPPAVVREAASSNEAERFEEVCLSISVSLLVTPYRPRRPILSFFPLIYIFTQSNLPGYCYY